MHSYFASHAQNLFCRLGWMVLPVCAALLTFVALPATGADADGRSGKEVVDATCKACHATGKDGAPRIGDRKAWRERASRGLTGLTQSALAGIRKMPAHGGSPDATDLEISRAITYMVNQSGGQWAEPIAKSSAAPKASTPIERSGMYIVQTQCGKCHLTGENGAPKIGDRAAWVQRLKTGLDPLVRSAFNGHGPMPARGGLADITFNELRNAIVFMFNPASAIFVPALPAADAKAAPADSFHKLVGNTEVYLGIVPAESIRAAQKDPSAPAIIQSPTGANYFHLNISLFDRVSKAMVTDADVEANVADPVLRRETKPLEILAINRGISYGGFFQMPTRGRYAITVTIKRHDALAPDEVKFDFNRE